MATKIEIEAKAASAIIYNDYAPRIAAAEGVERKALTVEAHAKAVEAAQVKSPNINVTSIKNQLGGKVRSFREKNRDVVKPVINADNGGERSDKPDSVESSGASGGNGGERSENPHGIDPALQKYIKDTLAASLGKPEDVGANSINVPKQPPDPRVTKSVSEIAVQKVTAQFDAVIEKIWMDDYRKALFGAWKSMTGYKGDLGDLIVEAYDLFFQIKGVDLEIVTHRPLSIEKGKIISG